MTSDVPILATQRVQYYQSFNEVPASPPLKGAGPPPPVHIMWFDNASTGMVGDNIHIYNQTPTMANVTVSLPGATPLVFTVAGNTEKYVTFPPGTIGGPVTISSDQPVLAAQRIQYYQTFNEVEAS